MEKEPEQIRGHIGVLNLEKRKFPRFKVDLPVEYYPAETMSTHGARVLNASEGGLLLYVSEELEIGQRLRLKLSFYLGPEWTTFEATAEVTWMDIHLGKDWGDYRTGVRFIDVSPVNLGKLKEFLRSLSG
jgi:c-di-GMP-binding flagellar brake protein YcgR